MQVKPVPAIYPLHIRQKPTVTLPSDSDNQVSPGAGFETGATMPAHIAVYGSQRDAYRGDSAEFAMQLIAENRRGPETHLEQRAYVEQYTSAATRQSEQNTHSVSLFA